MASASITPEVLLPAAPPEPPRRPFVEWLRDLVDRIRRLLELRANGERITLKHFLAVWAAHFWLKLRVFTAKRSCRAKCPACGHRELHKIRWEAEAKTQDGKLGALIHTCAVCTALWSDRPIVDADTWRVLGALDEPEQPPNHETLPPLRLVG